MFRTEPRPRAHASWMAAGIALVSAVTLVGCASSLDLAESTLRATAEDIRPKIHTALNEQDASDPQSLLEGIGSNYLGLDLRAEGSADYQYGYPLAFYELDVTDDYLHVSLVLTASGNRGGYGATTERVHACVDASGSRSAPIKEFQIASVECPSWVRNDYVGTASTEAKLNRL